MPGRHAVASRPLIFDVLLAWKPHVQPAIMIPVLVGITAAGRSWPTPVEWTVVVCVGLFYMGGVSALNDVFDLERDRINHPDRLLVRGDLTVNHYIVGLVVGPIVVSMFLLVAVLALERWLLVTGLLCLIEVMHLVYGLHPNLGMAGFGRQMLLVVGPMLLALIGGVCEGGVTARLILCAVSVGLFFGAGIILKDLSDIPGDRESGLVTLPIRWGRENAVRISCFGQLVAIVLGCTHLVLARAAPLAFGWMALSLVVSSVGTVALLRRRQRYWGPGMLMAYAGQFIFELALISSNI